MTGATAPSHTRHWFDAVWGAGRKNTPCSFNPVPFRLKAETKTKSDGL